MIPFIHDDFLLRSGAARTLYHDHARTAPIIDYHCHLDPADLAADRRFANVAQLWVTGDPYKHRAMRMSGVPEQTITGSAPDREKFDRWAATVPRTLGNPLHHWTALELKMYFDITDLLTPKTAPGIWDECNRRLSEPGFSARSLLMRAGVECVCTSDRLLDDLSPHAHIRHTGAKTRVIPSLRADDIVDVDVPDFLRWKRKLDEKAGARVSDFDGYCAAVRVLLDGFSQAGCRLADHGLDDFHHEPAGEGEVARLFAWRLAGEALTAREAVQVKTAILRFLGIEYARRGWVMQLHVGAHRHTSSRLRRLVGPAGGYAGIGSGSNVPALIAWLDDLERQEALPRTLLYPLNPADFVPLAVLAGSFVEEGVPGKIQLGPAWWFNDHPAGIRAQLDAVASYGLLSAFVGMTTDSRSLLSMARHDYFRRVLCDWLGDQVEAGALPADLSELGGLVRSLSHENARRYLTL